MTYDGVQLEIKNVDPKDEIRGVISKVAEKIHLNAPSDAVVKLAIKAGQNACEAYCRVASQVGIFVAEAAAANPLSAVLMMENKIKNQLDAWKSRRFGSAGNIETEFTTQWEGIKWI